MCTCTRNNFSTKYFKTNYFHYYSVLLELHQIEGAFSSAHFLLPKIMYHRMNAEKEERDKEFFKQKRADEEAEKKKLNSMSEDMEALSRRRSERARSSKITRSHKDKSCLCSGAAKNIGGGRGVEAAEVVVGVAAVGVAVRWP